VLISHPSLSGLSSGTGTSGSTGWSNSVRGRLYLNAIKDEKGSILDPDLRLLSLKKTNYGPPGFEMRLRYVLGRFIAMEGHGKPTGFDKIARDTKAERAFLDLLAAFTAQGRSVSDSPGPNYAPAIFANQGAEPMTKAELKAAMDRLLFARRIRVDTFGPPSRQRKSIVFVGQEENDA
jgi:RecA-family ATPase